MTTNKYIFLKSGIGNQLIPLISIIRMCDKYDYKLNVIFERIVAYNFSKVNSNSFSIRDLIKVNYDYNIINSIPNNCIKYNCGWNTEKNIIGINDEDNIFYDNVCHVFGGADDNIQLYCPYPRTNLKTTNFLSDLKKYAKLITPVKEIKDKLDNYIKYINTLDLKILGLHIRSLDGGFINLYNENRLFNYIDNFLDNNKNWKIYLSTDNKNIEDKLISKYKDSILKLDNPFGNNYEDKFSDNNYGLMNSMYEIFMLSKCDKLVGSVASSFSFLAWLLSSNDSLEFWNEQ